MTATINYKFFITQTINFLLMALVVFLAVKAISRLEKIGKQHRKRLKLLRRKNAPTAAP